MLCLYDFVELRSGYFCCIFADLQIKLHHWTQFLCATGGLNEVPACIKGLLCQERVHENKRVLAFHFADGL